MRLLGLKRAILFAVAIVSGVALTYGAEGENVDKYELTTPNKHILYSAKSIENMKKVVAGSNKKSHAYKCYKAFLTHPNSSSKYKGGPFPTHYVENAAIKQYDRDIIAAHMNAIMWAVTGDKAHAEVARRILVGYTKIKTFVVGKGNPLRCGGAYHVVAAYDLLRTYDKFKKSEAQAVLDMLKSSYLPMIKTFYDTPPYTNGNWGLTVTRAYLAIAVACNDKEMYRDAVQKFLYNKDNGSLKYYIDPVTGQLQESGRDQGHVQYGLTCAVTLCEIAYNQGHDLYSEFDNSILKGFEYTAKYLLNSKHGKKYDVPYKVWKDQTVKKKYSRWQHINAGESKDPAKQGRNDYYRPCWVVAYNHYVNRKGLEMPYTKEWLDKEGWGRNTPKTPYYFYDTLWYEAFLFND